MLLAYFVQKDPWYDLIWIVIFTIILPVVGLLLVKNKLWVGAILLGIAFVCQLVLTVLSASSFGDGLTVIDVLLILGVAIAVFGLMSLVPQSGPRRALPPKTPLPTTPTTNTVIRDSPAAKSFKNQVTCICGLRCVVGPSVATHCRWLRLATAWTELAVLESVRDHGDALDLRSLKRASLRPPRSDHMMHRHARLWQYGLVNSPHVESRPFVSTSMTVMVIGKWSEASCDRSIVDELPSSHARPKHLIDLINRITHSAEWDRH